MQKDGNKEPAKQAAKPRSKRKTIQELTKEHIQNEDHKITEEDFKNVVLETNIQKGKIDALDLPDRDDRPHDEDKDHSITTPWDVIK
jgi:hypothetical protein